MSKHSKPVRPDEDRRNETENADVDPIENDEKEQAEEKAGDGRPEDAGETQGEDEQPGEEEAGEPVRRLPCPGSPSAAERLDHEISHWPYRPWCEACVRGRAVGPNSKRIPEASRESIVPKAHLDYAYLQDEVIEDDDEFVESGQVGMSMTILIMTETLCDSVWAYVTSAKGFASDAWLPKKLHNDLTTVGMGLTRIIVKTDTEPAILDLRREMSKARGDAPTGFEDSRVGDSNSNAKIERVIRDVKGLIRTMRADLQEKTKHRVALEDPIVPWMVRHAGYVLTRCRVHPCGRTSLHRMKGQKTHRPMIPFGEAVMFKIPKTKRRLGDFEDRFEKGIWLGLTVQSGENIVGTLEGVYRVGGIMRCAPDKRWSSGMIRTIVGTPAEPKPGSGSETIPTYAKQQRSGTIRPESFQIPAEREAPRVLPAYITAKDVKQYEPTAGCKACQMAISHGSSRGFSHTAQCRLRFEEIFRSTGSAKLARADARMNEEIFRQSGNTEDPAAETGDSAMERDETLEITPLAATNADESAAEPGDAGSRVEETARSPARKRPAEDEAEDGSHEQGEPTSASASTSTPAAVAGQPEADTQKRKADDDPEDERPNAFQCTDAMDDKQYDSPLMQIAKELVRKADISEYKKDETVGSRELFRHPGPITASKEITSEDQRWQDIGSGVFARTFVQARRLVTTTRGGPPMEDVHRRSRWSMSKGKVIDDCVVDDTSDETLNRWLDRPDDIRVELTMKGALSMFHRHGADVSEVYSQPRIAQAAASFNKGDVELQPGWSLDLTRADPSTGKAWDLSKPEVQSRVVKLVRSTQPLFLIGSPPCTAFSPLQNLSRAKRDPVIVQAELEAGRVHLAFSMRLYMMQIEAGRFFVHEHPHDAASWSGEVVMKVASIPGAETAVVDMCAYGMRVDTGPVQGPARKRTRIMSNSHEVIKRIARTCPNESREESKHHVHVPLEQGRAKRCQVYPREFSRKICEGIAAEKKLRRLGLVSMELMDIDDLEVDVAKGHEASQDLHEQGLTQAFDDQSGERLLPDMVRKARKEEMDYFRSMNVYEKVPTAECVAATGRKPIAVRWVDINKGDTAQPNYRSRLVAKEFKGNDERPEWFAATPPSECLKLMLHRLASDKKNYADVSRAYFYAPAVRPVYVQLPDEDRTPGDSQMCGKLRVSMYGTRDAAMNWATEYGSTLKKAGFVQGRTSPCLFFNRHKNVAIMVHGDDFVAVGDPVHLADTEAALREKYKLKTETLSNETGDAKEVRILNKVVRITEEGVELEADPRHAELVVRELGVGKSKPSKVPGVKVMSGEKKSIKPSERQEVSIMEGDESEGESTARSDSDAWTCRGEGGVWRRQHSRKRQMLFTPYGTSEGPRRPSELTGKRITEGTFDETGEEFTIVDDWKDKREAHRRLQRSWTGTTTFEMKKDETASITESPIGMVKVRKSAGKIVEIRKTDEDDITIDEVNQAWELLSVAEGAGDELDPALEGKEATCYRSVAARLNYMGPDRVDLQYATKESARHMSTPRESHLGTLRKIGKYLIGRPRLVSHFKWQTPMTMVTGYTDSDWAGCTVTARSTSGGAITIGDHVIKTYSKQQKTVAFSSAEAELHAMVLTSAEVLGVIGLCKDLGVEMKGEILADSSAALGISNRTGAGNVRHLRIQALWVQEVRSTGRLAYKKVLGTMNPSDILTKHVPGDLLDCHLRTLGTEVRGGRAETAPTLDTVEAEYMYDWIEGDSEAKVKKRNVRFCKDVTCRCIPATGKQLPTSRARKCKAAWADMEDERGVDSLQSEEIHGSRDEQDCDFETTEDEIDAEDELNISQAVERPGAAKLQGSAATHPDECDKPVVFSACASQSAHEFTCTYSGQVCTGSNRGVGIGQEYRQSRGESCKWSESLSSSVSKSEIHDSPKHNFVRCSRSRKRRYIDMGFDKYDEDCYQFGEGCVRWAASRSFDLGGGSRAEGERETSESCAHNTKSRTNSDQVYTHGCHEAVCIRIFISSQRGDGSMLPFGSGPHRLAGTVAR